MFNCGCWGSFSLLRCEMQGSKGVFCGQSSRHDSYCILWIVQILHRYADSGHHSGKQMFSMSTFLTQ